MSKKKIADNVDRIPVCHAAIPVLDESLIHYANIRKRPTAEADDVSVSEMLVGGEVNHIVLPLQNVVVSLQIFYDIIGQKDLTFNTRCMIYFLLMLFQ